MYYYIYIKELHRQQFKSLKYTRKQRIEIAAMKAENQNQNKWKTTKAKHKNKDNACFIKNLYIITRDYQGKRVNPQYRPYIQGNSS